MPKSLDDAAQTITAILEWMHSRYVPAVVGTKVMRMAGYTITLTADKRFELFTVYNSRSVFIGAFDSIVELLQEVLALDVPAIAKLIED